MGKSFERFAQAIESADQFLGRRPIILSSVLLKEFFAQMLSFPVFSLLSQTAQGGADLGRKSGSSLSEMGRFF